MLSIRWAKLQNQCESARFKSNVRELNCQGYPKLQTITDTDLDGAQTYLNALQRKIQQEQAILNGQVTPTPAPKPPSPTT